jgi:hypothetical protein
VRDKHGGAEHRRLTRVANERSRQAVFGRVRALHKEGRNVMEIARQTVSIAASPRHFEEYLSRRWSEGCVRGRRLFQEIRARGYTGSFSNLERLLAKWRNPRSRTVKTTSTVSNPRPVDPATGRSISPIVAAALCIKPRGLLTVNQAAKVESMKEDWPEPWSNGQTEGQINRLKALKRTMYGRAGPELFRARLLPV